jgi:hypothetical protein
MSAIRADIDEELEKLEANGQSIEELAQLEDGTGQQFLDFGDKLDLKVGGMKPTESRIKIKAISRIVKGQIGDVDDDEVVTVIVTARNAGTKFDPLRDGGGKAIGKIRTTTLEPISVLPVSAEQADQILGL